MPEPSASSSDAERAGSEDAPQPAARNRSGRRRRSSSAVAQSRRLDAHLAAGGPRFHPRTEPSERPPERAEQPERYPLCDPGPSGPLHRRRLGAHAGGRALREAREIEALLERIDRVLGCGKDAALLKALHLFERLAQLARTEGSDAAAVLNEALRARERVAELERMLHEAERRAEQARQVAEVRSRLPLDRLPHAGAAVAQHPAPPAAYGHPYPSPGWNLVPPPPAPAPPADPPAWRLERRALEIELDRMRHEIAAMRLEAIRRAAEQSLLAPAWNQAQWAQLAAMAAAPEPGEDGAGDGTAAPASPVEIFRRARQRTRTPARPVPARVVTSAPAPPPSERSDQEREQPPAAEPPAAQQALARAAARARATAAPQAAEGSEQQEGRVEVEPLASSKLPRAAATEPGGPTPAEPAARPAVELQRVEVSPEPDARGRGEYAERRVRLPKITF